MLLSRSGNRAGQWAVRNDVRTFPRLLGNTGALQWDVWFWVWDLLIVQCRRVCFVLLAIGFESRHFGDCCLHCIYMWMCALSLYEHPADLPRWHTTLANCSVTPPVLRGRECVCAHVCVSVRASVCMALSGTLHLYTQGSAAGQPAPPDITALVYHSHRGSAELMGLPTVILLGRYFSAASEM